MASLQTGLSQWTSFDRKKIEPVVRFVCIALCAYQLYTTAFGLLEPLKHRSVHLAFILVLAFLIYPVSRKSEKAKARISVLDLSLSIVSVVPLIYLFAQYSRIINRIELVSPLLFTDVVIGIMLILLILEATRRVVGLPLVIVAVTFLVYAFIGRSLPPGPFWHRGLSVKQLVDQLTMTLGGVFTTPLAVTSTYIFNFILFGAFLVKTGTGQAIIDLAQALTGHTKGGPAKVAVVSSGLFGMINGSSVANTASTGSFTIPMMKSMGYKPHYAAAVEAAASAGGQIMPPVMGAAAFVMAEMMGVNYLWIVKAAVLPALLFYIALIVMVHLRADRLRLETMERMQLKRAKEVFIDTVHLFLPILALMFMLVRGYSPLRASLIAVITLVLLAMLRQKSRMNLSTFADALVSGAKGSLVISTTCATAGIIIGVVIYLGVGFKFASAIVSWSGGYIVIALFLVMIVSIILGMGLPTTAAYIIAASIAVPPLIEMGVSQMAANLFVLYFACISAITPPVAVAAYTGAAIANADPVKTGFTAARLGISGFIVPFVFAFNQQLLLIGNVFDIVLTVISSLIGILAISFAFEGWIKTSIPIWMRPILFLGGFLMIFPGVATDGIGLLLIAPICVYSVMKYKNQNGVSLNTIPVNGDV